MKACTNNGFNYSYSTAIAQPFLKVYLRQHLFSNPQGSKSKQLLVLKNIYFLKRQIEALQFSILKKQRVKTNIEQFSYILQSFVRFYPVTMPIALPSCYLSMTHRFKKGRSYKASHSVIKSRIPWHF
jgi:hypothetical protein